MISPKYSKDYNFEFFFVLHQPIILSFHVALAGTVIQGGEGCVREGGGGRLGLLSTRMLLHEATRTHSLTQSFSLSYMHAHVRTHTKANTHTYTQVRTHTCTHTQTHTLTHTHTNAHTCTQTHTHIHTHTMLYKNKPYSP